MTAKIMHQDSILIVAPQQDEDRVLLDVLNGKGFNGIYIARDLSHALELLESNPAIDILLMQFNGKAKEEVTFCARLKADLRFSQMPIIGIAASNISDRHWHWGRPPPGVVDWIRSPVDPHEALTRIRAVLARPWSGLIETMPSFSESDTSVFAHYQSAMTLLAEIAEISQGEESIKHIVRLIVDKLDLDFLMIVSGRTENSPRMQALATYQRLIPAVDTPDPLKQSTLRKALSGETIAYPSEAWRQLEHDAFLQAMKFEAFIGVPLRDDHQKSLGALLLARRQPLTATSPFVEMLRIVADRLAMLLELNRARDQARLKGLQDLVTGLPNRLFYNDRLAATLAEAQHTGEMFAVLFIDLDRFKAINDSFGHSVGDQVLMGVSKRLRACVRASDVVARYAGDEFTLILRHMIQRDDVKRITEKIVQAMQAPLSLPDTSELQITASIGVSLYPDNGATSEELLKHADIAMYNAKGMGRNNFQAYVAMPEESHRQRLALESKLRQAEKNHELHVYYQPQIDTVTDDIVGMEALIRWEHPELGMISPGFFIPLAEEIGLIVSIGEWVLRSACADARRFNEQFGLSLRVGVNLSALQLRQPNLIEMIENILNETGLEARFLDIEVTESINVKTIPHLIETLQTFRNLGCAVSIDDFGTGQSSLDYIKRFPADRIKIDQTFVRNIGVDHEDEAIVAATISMAHNLNRRVVAEGVEMEEHLEFLRTHQCEEVQGYLFCRPLSAENFEAMLAERKRLFGGESFV